MAAISWLHILTFASSSLLLLLFVFANSDYCGILFESQFDHVLVGHVMETNVVADQFECQIKCASNDTCKSFNVRPSQSRASVICELNNKTRHTKPKDFKRKKGTNYYGSIKVSCAMSPHHSDDQVDSGKCHPDYKGKYCLTPIIAWRSHQPAHSCKHIRDSGDSKGNGEYWIDPEKSGNPLKVYCDMTTNGGGWLLVYNVVINGSAPSKLPLETSYRGVSNYQNSKMVLNPDAMQQLRSHLSFTQLRFHCSKPQGRTFHVTTAANSSGEAVVQFFSNESDVFPQACGSFERLEGDNSSLAADCTKWGKDRTGYLVGKWGHKGTRDLNKFPAFIRNKYHWSSFPELSDGSYKWLDRWECDDLLGERAGDWKIFVR